MKSIVLAGPAVEPISLAEMKAFLRTDAADEDALVLGLIAAARLAVERHTRLALVEQTWRVTMGGWPPGRAIRLPIGPVLGIAGVRLIDGLGSGTTLAPGLFRIDPAADAPVLLADPAAPEVPAAARVEIDLTCGFGAAGGAVPEPLRLAIRLLAARWFEHRGDDASAEGPGLPPAVAALLAPFRRTRLV